MPEVDFLPFGTGAEANVLTNAAYTAAAWRTNGWVSGILPSIQLNTPVRQAAFVASVVANYISDTLTAAVLDDGDLNGKVTLLTEAITATANAAITAGNYATAAALAAEIATRLANDNSEAATRLANDTTLLNDISNEVATEASTRSAGDMALTNSVSAEAALRIAGDVTAANHYQSIVAALVATDGHVSFPTENGNIVLQWGQQTTSGNSAVVTFPEPFPNNVFSFVALPIGGSQIQNNILTGGVPNLNNIAVYSSDSRNGNGVSPVAFAWIAVGN